MPFIGNTGASPTALHASAWTGAGAQRDGGDAAQRTATEANCHLYVARSQLVEHSRCSSFEPADQLSTLGGHPNSRSAKQEEQAQRGRLSHVEDGSLPVGGVGVRVYCFI